MNFGLIFIAIFIFLAAAIIFLFLLKSRLSKKDVNRALNMSLFLISLPRKTKKEEGEAPKNWKEIVAVMEQLYASLGHIKEKRWSLFAGHPPLAFELATPHAGEEICFYMAVPRRWEDIAEKQIHGFFPEAKIEKTKDYNIFNPSGAVCGAYFKLARDYCLPIKTYQNLEADPLGDIVNALSKLEEHGEGAAFQIIFKPTKKKWRQMGRKIAKKMQEGKDYLKARDEVVMLSIGKIISLVEMMFGDPVKKMEREAKKRQMMPMKMLTPLAEETIKALEGKAGKIGFEANLRILTSADTKEKAENILDQLEGAFAQFNAPNLNSFKTIRQSGNALQKLIYNFSFRLFDYWQRVILNTEELTSLFHFSVSSVESPKVKFLKAKLAAPPADLPKQGVILGKNTFRGIETIIRLNDDDRRRHLYVIGQTGTGKSAFLQNMAEQDILSGKGVAVLDPHGDLIEKMLSLVPKERAEDVILCDPSDLERPLGLNMLEYDPQRPEQKTFIVNELINIFDKLYDLKTTGGPMFEQYTRNALLLLMDDPLENATLMEIPRVLADKEFRHRLLAKCKNIIVKDFWEKEAEKAGGEASLANMVPYITSKFNTFIANDYMRPIIGQPKSSLNFREIIDKGKILLVSLPKGRLGEINSSLLGLIVVGKLVMSAFARIDMPEENRRDFYLYMDEFQNFTTEGIETALSEARKYRLCLIVAHQFIGQLPEEIRSAVFGNIGSFVSFRVGAEDSEFLIKHFEPVFDENDLINIDNYSAYIKPLINGATTRPFSLATYPPNKGNFEIAQNIKQLSRLKYGKEKDLIEKEIYERLKQAQKTF